MHVNDRGAATIAVQSVFTTIAFIIVALRIYVRFGLIRIPGPEDYVIIVSMLCSIGLTIGYGVQTGYGMGHHMADVPPQNIEPLFKWLYMSILVYCVNLGLTKISIVLQLIRIFGGTGGFMQRIYWLSLGLMMVYTAYSLFSGIFTCWPVAYWWDKSIVGGTCKQKPALWYFNAAFNITTDIWILLLPMPAIRSLQLPKKQKLGLAIVFTMGGIVALISILRIPALIETSNSTDITFDNIKLGIYSSVEVNVSIICASLPALKALFPRLMSSKTIFSSQTRARDNDKALERFGVESSAWRSHPMQKLSQSRDEESNGYGDDVGIKITTSVAQTVYDHGRTPNASREDRLSLSDSERMLVDGKK